MDEITTTFDGAGQALAAKADCAGVQMRRKVRGALAGADMPEYVIVVAAIVIVCITGWTLLGGNINKVLDKLNTTLGAVITADGGPVAGGGH